MTTRTLPDLVPFSNLSGATSHSKCAAAFGSDFRFKDYTAKIPKGTDGCTNLFGCKKLRCESDDSSESTNSSEISFEDKIKNFFTDPKTKGIAIGGSVILVFFVFVIFMGIFNKFFSSSGNYAPMPQFGGMRPYGY